VDSLHQDVLRGAILIVEGAPASAVADSLGRFRIDSVPSGRHTIAVIHPLLDTIGIVLQTPPLDLAAGQTVHLIISTPSIETLVTAKCTPAERSVGPAVLLGIVQFAESETPAAGAKVNLEWTEHRISKTRIDIVPRLRTATAGPDGRFRICGLPEETSGILTTFSGKDSTSAIGVHLSRLIGIVGLELPEAFSAAGANARTAPAATRNAVLTGRVLDRSGGPLSRARVAVDADAAYAITGQDGRFIIRGLPSGTRLVSVRKLGFEPTERAVNLHARSPVDITIKLGEFVALLDTVRIYAAMRDRNLDRVGFTKRKRLGTGFYMGPDDINRRNALDLPGLLSMAPMLRTVGNTITGRPSGVTVAAGGATSFTMECVTYVVDGLQWHGGGVEDFIRPAEVAAIEVYSRTSTPSQFATGFDQCETVVIWTKQKIGM
jgi:Carboxypeptidase regulatory-like domain